MVRRDGRVIYRVADGGLVSDEAYAAGLRVNQVTAGAAFLALTLAVDRFGDRPLHVQGTEDFRRQVAQVAGIKGLGVTFADAGLERQRQAMVLVTRANTVDRGAERRLEEEHWIYIIFLPPGLSPMKDRADPAPGTRKRLLGTAALLAGVVALSSAATQFVAWRVHYHPALGTPWFHHVYAPWSWITWMRAPWARNAKATFGSVDAGLTGVVSIGLVAGLVGTSNRRRKPVKHEGVHGTARFMTEQEIRQSGLLPGPGQQSAGVYVGGWTGAGGNIHYLRHDGPEHCIVIAPTRSGKGVGNILPTLLSWPASSLIYDEKGELWQLTAGWRSQHANNIVIRWEPGAVDGSAGFNFLEEVRLGTLYEVADAQNIAQMICDPNGDGIEGKDHWGKTSFDLLAAVMLHVMYKARKRGETASLADVAYALSDPEEKSDALWEEMRTNQHLPTGKHAVVAAAGRDQLDRPEKERGSVLSSAKTYLTLVKDPIIAANTQRSDFHIMELMNHGRPVSLYVVTRGGDKERLRPLVRLLLTMAMRQLMGVELKYREGQPLLPHQHRLLMMLDEFPSWEGSTSFRIRSRNVQVTASRRFLPHRTASRCSAPMGSTRASRPTATSASSTPRTNGNRPSGSAAWSATPRS